MPAMATKLKLSFVQHQSLQINRPAKNLTLQVDFYRYHISLLAFFSFGCNWPTNYHLIFLMPESQHLVCSNLLHLWYWVFGTIVCEIITWSSPKELATFTQLVKVEGGLCNLFLTIPSVRFSRNCHQVISVLKASFRPIIIPGWRHSIARYNHRSSGVDFRNQNDPRVLFQSPSHK